MKKLIPLLLIAAACSQQTEIVSESTNLPLGAVLSSYPGNGDLQKAMVKSGETLLEEGDVLNGQRHGTWTAYYPQGKIRTITSYLNGKKQGPEIQFDNSGYVTSKSPFVNGQLHGDYRAYARGTVTERKEYANGQLNGLVQKYYPNGVIMEESSYVDGVIDGEARWYNQGGDVTIKYTYDMGTLVDDGSGD